MQKLHIWYFNSAWRFKTSHYGSRKPLEAHELLTSVIDSTQETIPGAFLPDCPKNEALNQSLH